MFENKRTTFILSLSLLIITSLSTTCQSMFILKGVWDELDRMAQLQVEASQEVLEQYFGIPKEKKEKDKSSTKNSDSSDKSSSSNSLKGS